MDSLRVARRSFSGSTPFTLVFEDGPERRNRRALSKGESRILEVKIEATSLSKDIITKGYGRQPATIVAIFITWDPPLILAFGPVVYSALALRQFVVRRLTFAAHLQASNSAFTTSRYLRLISMAAIQMAGAITITSYALWFTSIAMPLRPWTSWDDVHFLRVDQYLTRIVPPALTRPFYISWWFTPISTFIFVAFFSFGKDALDEYKNCFAWIRTKVFRRSETSEKSKKGLGFVDLPSAKHSVLVISKPILQSTTSSDYTFPPYEAATRTTMSSLSQTIATLKVDEISEEGYKYQLRSSTSTIGRSGHTFALQPKWVLQRSLNGVTVYHRRFGIDFAWRRDSKS
ncbi:hypothetical protein H1R20_g872, partial [Candolleomyces eurysporus]